MMLVCEPVFSDGRPPANMCTAVWDEAGLPPLIDKMLRTANVTVPLGGPVSAAELEKSGMSPGDRIATKHALAALGRISG
jgi:hypothetical protein